MKRSNSNKWSFSLPFLPFLTFIHSKKASSRHSKFQESEKIWSIKTFKPNLSFYFMIQIETPFKVHTISWNDKNLGIRIFIHLSYIAFQCIPPYVYTKESWKNTELSISFIHLFCHSDSANPDGASINFQNITIFLSDLECSTV